MRNILKQSGAKATDSFDKRFNRSIIRLTILYSTALAVILFISGTVTYSTFSHRIRSRFEGFAAPPIVVPREMPTANQVREDFIESVIVVHSALFIIGVILSYLLAERTLQPIKDAYKRQQRFIGDASHELRTPLSILQMEIENELTHNALHEGATSKLEEVKRMGKIVNDLLLLSRLDETGEHAYRFSNISLAPILESIISRLQPLARVHGVSIKATFGKSDAVISGNEDLVSHAITNFIKNAIIYNKKDGVVDIDIREEGKKIGLYITDTGKGIAPQELQYIFNRFYRIDESRSSETGGSGLGLSIAQSSLEKMGAMIDITSTLGEGTKIHILFARA